MRRAAGALLFGLALVTMIPAVAEARSAGEPVPTTTSTTLLEPGQGVPGNIIPRPNSGVPPEEPGDRGGWEQLAVLGALALGIVIIVLLVVRESRRKRRVP